MSRLIAKWLSTVTYPMPPSAKCFVENAHTCAFVVALMYWVVHAMLNASVILPPWPSRPTWHWKTAFCYSTCIHTKLHGHGHCRCDWTVTGEMLPMVKIRVPRPKGIRCIWLECIHVCHTEDAERLHEAHNARVEISYYVLSCWSIVT